MLDLVIKRPVVLYLDNSYFDDTYVLWDYSKACRNSQVLRRLLKPRRLVQERISRGREFQNLGAKTANLALPVRFNLKGEIDRSSLWAERGLRVGAYLLIKMFTNLGLFSIYRFKNKTPNLEGAALGNREPM